MNKKLLLGFLLFFVSLQAFAIVPLIMAATRIISAGMKTTTGQDIAFGSVIAVGLTIAQMNWQSQQSDKILQNNFNFTNAPRPPSAAEAAAGFTAGYPSLTPAATATGVASLLWTCSAQAASCPPATTPARATPADYEAYCVSINTSRTDIHISAISATRYGCGTPASPEALFTLLGTEGGLSCPAGYIASGSSCVLSVAAAVVRPKDGYCPINRTGNTYAPDASDPDCFAGWQTGYESTTPQFYPDGTFSVSDSSGNRISGRLNGIPDQREIVLEVADPVTNTTSKRTITIHQPIDPAKPPAIVGVADGVYQGTGAGVSATQNPPSASIDTSSLEAKIQAATDAAAARAAAEEAANSAAPRLLNQDGRISDAAAANLNALTAAFTGAANAMGTDEISAGAALMGFVFTPPISTCVPFAGVVHGYNISWDLCPTIENIRAVLGWIFALFGAYSIFLIFFRSAR